MAFENMDDIEPGVEEAGPPPEESNNRTFLIVAGILGGIMLLALLCLAGYAAIQLPRVRDANATQQAQATAVQITQEFFVQQTLLAQAPSPTATPTIVVATATQILPTNTPVVALPATHTPTTGPDPRTATVAALLTQAAAIQTTAPAVPTSTMLPDSGFADDVGMPGLLAVAMLLVGVIFLARRMRTAH